jgi:hypothetical protein
LPFCYADTHRRLWFNKKPAIDWQSRVSKKFSGSEWSPHVAKGPGTALPAGRLPADQRDAQLDVRRNFHVELRTVNYMVAGLSKKISGARVRGRSVKWWKAAPRNVRQF